MDQKISIRRMEKEDIGLLERAFTAQGIVKQEGYFSKCFHETVTGERVTLLGFYNDHLAGCCHLIIKPKYAFFRDHHIPEINDLNVFVEYRKKGIASLLIDRFEKIAAETFDAIGIGVGLYEDYGTAQRLYCKKGYIPDGRGVQYKDETVPAGEYVHLDDDLVLRFTKSLGDRK
ncbi:ribosomal protein S18 acetylase RimI-like enzyme [Scopulibacillus darangshiensis]|uniref:Ribosomal protein S18 acetylase RimI-like enzyme n=1 Tax=Scopulibacillus darangshiensis TaxID=442528 RepID=A0A4R2NP05_9BACL|nr:GNAT family N-acetyltransferase [Scopulibacillus darangshiensis]TCP23529.1 ribosomal protein S18 acetylase RimI-like enzyme [Scopulibacillus darangshiensis]